MKMDNLRGFLGIIRMDRRPNAWIGNLYGVIKWVDERIDDHTEGMGNDRIARRVYVVECVGNGLVGRLHQRRIASVAECLKKKWILGKQGEWRTIGMDSKGF